MVYGRFTTCWEGSAVDDDPGGFLAAGIRAIVADLPEDVRTALRNQIRERHLGLAEQLDLVAAVAWAYHTLPSTIVVLGMEELPERPEALQRAREAVDRMLGERA